MKNPTPEQTYNALVDFLATFGVTPDMCPRDGLRIGNQKVIITVYATDPNGRKVAIGDELLKHTYTFPFDQWVTGRIEMVTPQTA